RKTSEAGIDPGMDIEYRAECADHQRISAPVWFQCNAPIRRDAAELTGRTERIATYRILLTEADRFVSGEFQIKQVVDKRVGADAADMRGKGALDRRVGAARAIN